jgi:3-phenylpropionate/trans-cinnamate dioxygenase ferredoxin subunit
VATRKFVVGRADDLAEGERMVAVVNNRSIGIFNIGGRYYGLLNRCPHRGAELCKGRFAGNLSATAPGDYQYDATNQLLMCPWHGWEFDVPTGQSYFDPKGVRARPYEVEVSNGAIVAREIEAGETGFTPQEYAAVAGDQAPGPGDQAPRSDGRIPGPYKAETVEITVEDDYLVVNLRPPRPARPARPSSVEES